MKENRAITLIALAITIIVLLILAGVTVAILTGDNGILKNTKMSVDKNNIAKAKEEIQMKIQEMQTDKVSRNNEYLTISELSSKDSKYYIVNNIKDLSILNITSEKIFIVYSDYIFSIDKNMKISYENEKNNLINTAILKNVEVEIGKIENIPIVANGMCDITCRTLDQSVAKIENNKIKGINVGTTTLEVTINNWCGPKGENVFYSKITCYTQKIDVENLEEFITIVAKANSGEDSYEGKCINIEKNLDLNKLEAEQEWIPIGNKTNAFKGTIAGNGNTIIGLSLGSNDDYQGFVGVNEGIIKDINISSDSNAESLGGKSGILCGENRGLIENCTSRGTFNYTKTTAKYWQGAICGFNNGGTIRNCANYGSVTGYGNVGGIAGGCGNGGVIINCYNKGDINSAYTYDAGGICGNASQSIGKAYFFNCYNSGSITCKNYNVGGINGMSTNETYLYNCYNVGSIGSSRRCSISYWESTAPHLQNCFTLNTITNSSMNDGATTKTEEELTSQTMIETLNNGIDIVNGSSNTESPWVPDEKNEKGEWKYNNGYPVLKWQLEE